MQVSSIDDLPSYVAFLRSHPEEAISLQQDLLASGTNFFRDQEAFQALHAELLKLFADKPVARKYARGCRVLLREKKPIQLPCCWRQADLSSRILLRSRCLLLMSIKDQSMWDAQQFTRRRSQRTFLKTDCGKSFQGKAPVID